MDQRTNTNESKTALVVLGAAVWQGGKPSPSLERRAKHGAMLSRTNGRAIIASGGLGKFPPSEAHMIRTICEEQGVAFEDVFLEDRSISTLTNLQNSFELADQHNLNICEIVTDFYHVPRVKLTLELMAKRNVKVCFSTDDLAKTGFRKIATSVIREVPAIIVYSCRLVWLKLKGKI